MRRRTGRIWKGTRGWNWRCGDKHAEGQITIGAALSLVIRYGATQILIQDPVIKPIDIEDVREFRGKYLWIPIKEVTYIKERS